MVLVDLLAQNFEKKKFCMRSFPYSQWVSLCLMNGASLHELWRGRTRR